MKIIFHFLLSLSLKFDFWVTMQIFLINFRKFFCREHFFEIKELYDRQASLKQSLDEYQLAISSVSNTALLDKALKLGEITVIEYFLEVSFYQNALLHFLKTEREYQAAVAELMRYRL